MKKVVDLCNGVGVMVEVIDIETCHRLFQKESNNQLPSKSIVMFVNRQFAEDAPSKWNIRKFMKYELIERLGLVRL